jgi:hypothetical protein
VVKLYFYMRLPNRPSFVEAIYRIQSSVDMIAAKEFWTEKFSCIELKQSPKLQKSAGASALIHSLCSLPYSKIQDGAKNLRCTPQVLLQAAFAISLSRLQGTALSFGLVVSEYFCVSRNLAALMLYRCRVDRFRMTWTMLLGHCLTRFHWP